MNKRVIILSGVSGSGKSTVAKLLWPFDPFDTSMTVSVGAVEVVSADYHFNEHGAKGGKYTFDASKLEEAHSHCLLSFIESCELGYTTIVVDNTNTTVVEIAPYYAIARAYGYEVVLVGVLCHDYDAAGRNVHGVPIGSIGAQLQCINNRQIPPFWKLGRYEVATEWQQGSRFAVIDACTFREVDAKHPLVAG